MSCPDVGYFFAFDSVKFYRNIEPEMKAVRDAGFNVLYLLYMPYRSEDGRPTPWQEDIPLNDPDFASVPPPVRKPEMPRRRHSGEFWLLVRSTG